MWKEKHCIAVGILFGKKIVMQVLEFSLCHTPASTCCGINTFYAEDIPLGWITKGSWFDCEQGQQIFLSLRVSRSTLGSTWPSIQWATGYYPAVKWPICEVYHSCTCSGKVHFVVCAYTTLIYEEICQNKLLQITVTVSWPNRAAQRSPFLMCRYQQHLKWCALWQWRTQECCSGGVQQIQLRTEDRENGDLGTVAP
jgi:hypothetical protein